MGCSTEHGLKRLATSGHLVLLTQHSIISGLVLIQKADETGLEFPCYAEN
jgi:hypothetical protein